MTWTVSPGWVRLTIKGLVQQKSSIYQALSLKTTWQHQEKWSSRSCSWQTNSSKHVPMYCFSATWFMTWEWDTTGQLATTWEVIATHYMLSWQLLKQCWTSMRCLLQRKLKKSRFSAMSCSKVNKNHWFFMIQIQNGTKVPFSHSQWFFSEPPHPPKRIGLYQP